MNIPSLDSTMPSSQPIEANRNFIKYAFSDFSKSYCIRPFPNWKWIVPPKKSLKSSSTDRVSTGEARLFRKPQPQGRNSFLQEQMQYWCRRPSGLWVRNSHRIGLLPNRLWHRIAREQLQRHLNEPIFGEGQPGHAAPSIRLCSDELLIDAHSSPCMWNMPQIVLHKRNGFCCNNEELVSA